MFKIAISLLALVGAAQAHMSLFYPPPLGAAPSINKQSTGALDKEFNFPLGCCGSDGDPTEPSPGICRGHIDKFDTEDAQVTWKSGQDAHFQLTDFTYDPDAVGSTHSGGSCQVGFSVDKGKTWKVAASYHGACPKHTEDGSPEAQSFDFKVPTGMPAGPAIFMWNWLNREHEAFQSCAKVMIESDSGSSPPAQPSTPPKPSQSPQQPPPTQSSKKPTPPSPSPSKQPPANTSPDPDSNYGNRPHPTVLPGDRKYNVDNWTCLCGQGPKNSQCICIGDERDVLSPSKRAAAEKKALRMHRRSMYKRVDSCDWASAPTMETSYYTSDAKCAPNAKINVPESDDFELSWDVKCGVVQGDGEYPLKMMQCGMYGA